MENTIKIICPEFSGNYYEKDEYRAFDVSMSNGSIVVLEENCKDDLVGYRLNDSNYILFDKNETIVGVLLKNISAEDMRQIEESEIM